MLRWKLQQLLLNPCPLLSASQRAVKGLIADIDSFVPQDVDEIFGGKLGHLHSWQASSLSGSIANFETILGNDMPEMSTFSVAQIGILRTDDLINSAFRQIAEPLRDLLRHKAKADIMEAGKCLAFRVSTASAFHVCRAIEAGMDQYYEALSGFSYKVSANGGEQQAGGKD